MSSSTSAGSLKIQNLSFSYGQNEILKNIDMTIGPGENLSLIGPSGFGKTTLLQLIAGDLAPQTGEIQKSGLWRRVFQKSSLLPWLTVEENIKMGLRGINNRAPLDFSKLVELLDLVTVLKSYPRELSGGQGQRVEIARALIGKPDGLLLDEPFSSLDYLIRHETRNYLANLLKEFPITLVLVTHDIAEAVSFTNKSYILNGRPATITKKYDNKNHGPELIDQIWKDLKA